MTSKKAKEVFDEVSLRERGTDRWHLFDPIFMYSFVMHRTVNDHV